MAKNPKKIETLLLIVLFPLAILTLSSCNHRSMTMSGVVIKDGVEVPDYPLVLYRVDAPSIVMYSSRPRTVLVDETITNKEGTFTFYINDASDYILAKPAKSQHLNPYRFVVNVESLDQDLDLILNLENPEKPIVSHFERTYFENSNTEDSKDEPNDTDNPVNSPENPKNQLDD